LPVVCTSLPLYFHLFEVITGYVPPVVILFQNA
jgi:hypothetical protein